MASELLFLRNLPYDRRLKTLVIFVSRTGQNSVCRRAFERVKHLHPKVRTLSISSRSGWLSEHCDHSLATGKHELGSVPSLSPSCLLATLLLIWSRLTKKEALKKRLALLTRWYQPLDPTPLDEFFREPPDQLIFLGQGPYFGLALAGRDQARQLLGMPASAVTHSRFEGPPVIPENTHVICFCSKTNEAKDLTMLAVLRRNGVKTLAFTAKETQGQSIPLAEQTSELERPLLALLMVQWSLYYLSLRYRRITNQQPNYLGGLP